MPFAAGKNGQRRVEYSYRTQHGELFSCVCRNVEEARPLLGGRDGPPRTVLMPQAAAPCRRYKRTARPGKLPGRAVCFSGEIPGAA